MLELINRRISEGVKTALTCIRDWMAMAQRAVRGWPRSLVVTAVVLVAVLLSSGVVPESLTREDVEALLGAGVVLSQDIDIAGDLQLDRQKEVLQAVLSVVHARIRNFEPVPIKSSREPAVVLALGTGVCFDRARVIEKATRLLGFETRRVFLLYGGWRNLFVAGSASHTLVEVKTKAGWVFLGTLSPVIGFDEGGRAWSVNDLANDARTSGDALDRNHWMEIVKTTFSPIYGVYSRTGNHYWPYTPVPDYSIRQMVSAWTD